MNGVIQTGPMAALWCVLLVVASNPPAAMARTDARFDNARLAFLSGSDDARRPAEQAPGAPQQDNRNFDGVWIFTSAGCPYTGSLAAKIVGGKIIVRGGGGQVDPDGTLHSVGAGNRMTLTATGQLSGDTGSGTFDRSDGCTGTWVAIRRGTLRGRRP